MAIPAPLFRDAVGSAAIFWAKQQPTRRQSRVCPAIKARAATQACLDVVLFQPRPLPSPRRRYSPSALRAALCASRPRLASRSTYSSPLVIALILFRLLPTPLFPLTSLCLLRLPCLLPWSRWPPPVDHLSSDLLPAAACVRCVRASRLCAGTEQRHDVSKPDVRQLCAHPRNLLLRQSTPY